LGRRRLRGDGFRGTADTEAGGRAVRLRSAPQDSQNSSAVAPILFKKEARRRATQWEGSAKGLGETHRKAPRRAEAEGGFGH
jgi:hypothetical protein